jgi:hypothetical protein
VRAARSRGAIRYSFSAHSLSNLKMTARLTQHSLEPGAHLGIRAVLTEYGIPVDHRASVIAEVERPDGTLATLAMAEGEAGVFDADIVAALSGVYRFRVLAHGATLRGEPFTREQLLTGVAIPDGDALPPTTKPGSDSCGHLCELFKCLIGNEALAPLLHRLNVNPAGIYRCLEGWCQRCEAGPTPEELARREGTGG